MSLESLDYGKESRVYIAGKEMELYTIMGDVRAERAEKGSRDYYSR